MKKELTPKQAMFVKEYLVDLNGTQAAIRAGYSPKTANEQAARLLASVSIKEAVQEEMDKRAARVEITSDYVLTTIQETIERCKQARPVLTKTGSPVLVETPEGDIAPAYTFESNSVLKGCELLGRHLKLFSDHIVHTGDPDNPIEIKSKHVLSDEALIAIIKASNKPS